MFKFSLISLLIILIMSSILLTGEASAGLFDEFIDEEDGYIDGSKYLLDNSAGFLPLPLIITEPALGVGAGARPGLSMLAPGFCW